MVFNRTCSGPPESNHLIERSYLAASKSSPSKAAPASLPIREIFAVGCFSEFIWNPIPDEMMDHFRLVGNEFVADKVSSFSQLGVVNKTSVLVALPLLSVIIAYWEQLLIIIIKVMDFFARSDLG